MAEIVRVHEYDAVRGVCVHCGDKASENVGEHEGRACIAREIPRAVPASVFADLGAIGDRAREIREAEGIKWLEIAILTECCNCGKVAFMAPCEHCGTGVRASDA